MMVSLYLRDVGKMGPSDSAFWSVSRPIVSSAVMVFTGRLLQRCKARGYSYRLVVSAAAVVGVVDKTMSVTFGWNGGADKPTLVTMLALQGAVAAVSSIALRVLILELVSEDERGSTNGTFVSISTVDLCLNPFPNTHTHARARALVVPRTLTLGNPFLSCWHTSS